MVAMGVFHNITIPEENVLSPDEVKVFSCALSHKFRGEELSDPFFMDEEWEKIITARHSLLEEAQKIFDKIHGE